MAWHVLRIMYVHSMNRNDVIHKINLLNSHNHFTVPHTKKNYVPTLLVYKLMDDVFGYVFLNIFRFMGKIFLMSHPGLRELFY